VQVLTRRLAALEALGCISVLCVDKTGTLTCNRMQVAELHAGGTLLRLAGRQAALAAPFAQLVQCASLASKRRAYDPMEIAFHRLAGGALRPSRCANIRCRPSCAPCRRCGRRQRRRRARP
jgi:Ca2+-transporting ATPase